MCNSGNMLPPAHVWTNVPVEAHENFLTDWFSEIGHHNPCDRRHNSCRTCGLGEQHGGIAAERIREAQQQGSDECHNHRRDLAPGIDAPPVPSQQIHRAGSGAEFQHPLPSRLNRSKLRSDESCTDDQEDRYQS